MWWLLLALIPIIAYVAMNYSKVQVSCSTCPNKTPDIE